MTTSCLVPSCKISQRNNPCKIFFSIPRDQNKRNLWFEAIGLPLTQYSAKSHLYVCENHFNLQEDMENYIQFKLMGGYKRLKPNVVPHLAVESAKRIKLDLYQPPIERDPIDISASSITTQDIAIQVGSNLVDASVQVNPSRRSKFTQCVPIKTKDMQCSPLKMFNVINEINLNQDNLSSPKKKMFSSLDSGSTASVCSLSNDKEDIQSLPSSIENWTESVHSGESFEANFTANEMKVSAVRVTLFIIETNPKIYLGIPNECYFVLNILQSYVKSEFVDILIVLKKIKTDLPYVQLGHDFNMSKSKICRKFLKCVPKIASYMLHLIVWPASRKITENVPLSFRARFGCVQSIIDCFEIEIEKPTNPVFQSLTWSEYKKRNTIKYLISCTPNGIINFISNGFGGRTSDTVITEKSDFLNKLPSGSTVMADRGFKHVEPLLMQRRCKLVRPPSVPSGEKLSKDNVILTKKIASLRIHIERVINRIREFKMLKHNASLDHAMLSNIDNIVIIACGLLNLQNPLIKL